VLIDKAQCNGCGLCISTCAEGALQIVDGKAWLVSGTYCDGLGACLGHCPQGALHVIECEAEAFDADAVHASLARNSPPHVLAGQPYGSGRFNSTWCLRKRSSLRIAICWLSPTVFPSRTPMCAAISSPLRQSSWAVQSLMTGRAT
jgi:NAD-dependent dihydropyrimidine dehydrogenase PreA subunit